MVKNIKHYRFERNYDIEVSKIKLIEFNLIRETDCGYWIKEFGGFKEIFVLKLSKKRYAYPSKIEAFESFKKRTKKSKEYAERNLLLANRFLKLIDEFDENNIK